MPLGSTPTATPGPTSRRSGSAATSDTADMATPRAAHRRTNRASAEDRRNPASMQCHVIAVGRPRPTVTRVLSHGERRDDPGLHVGDVEAPSTSRRRSSAGANGLIGSSHGSRAASRCTGTPSTTVMAPCISPSAPRVAVNTSTSWPAACRCCGQVVRLHLDPAQPGQVAVGQERHLHGRHCAMGQDG